MQAINPTRKAAFSFLSNLSLHEPSNSNVNANRDPILSSKNVSCFDNATTESPDPKLDIPPDPDLESFDRIRSTNSGSSPVNHFHKLLKSKRDRAAADFLSNITLSSPVIPEGVVLAMSPPDSIAIPSDTIGGRSSLHRTSTISTGFQRKPHAESIEENDSSCSSLDSSSDDEHHFFRATGYCTDEDNKLSSSRKSSCLIDVSAVFDSIPTQAMSVSPVFAEKPNRRSRTRKGSKKNSSTKRNTDSYAHLLAPKHALVPDPPSDYNPLYLDDPSIQLEAKTSGLYSIMDSLMQFAKTGESAIDSDVSFLAAHPSVDISLSLVSIRSIKSKMIAVAQHLDLELASVAHAFVYFEKLCLQGLVNKETRRLKGAACLFLAIKINEHKRKLEGFMDAVDKHFDVSERELRGGEFATFAELEFNLLLPENEFIPHLERILKDLGNRSR